MTERVPPSVSPSQKIRELLTAGSAGDIRSELLNLAVRMTVEEFLEAETSEAVGRGRYQRNEAGHKQQIFDQRDARPARARQRRREARRNRGTGCRADASAQSRLHGTGVMCIFKQGSKADASYGGIRLARDRWLDRRRMSVVEIVGGRTPTTTSHILSLFLMPRKMQPPEHQSLSGIRTHSPIHAEPIQAASRSVMPRQAVG